MAPMFISGRQVRTLGLWLALMAPAVAANPPLPDGIQTHPDGRLPIERLLAAYLSLRDRGWHFDIVAESQPAGREAALPIIALRSPIAGEAVWILSGIHGEETAGPNAIAAAIETVAQLGERRPVVLMPLNNPHGYVQNWRYLNLERYSATVDGQSVGDSSHLLPDPDDPQRPRAPAASSPEAEAITRYVLATSADYPPVASIDLHEDNLIRAGYVYSQGRQGAADPLAHAAVRVLEASGIPLQMGGETRFGERIEGGIIGPVADSSIDELMSAATVIVNGEARPGPAARTVLVFETPAEGMPLQRRVEAHAALLKLIADELAPGQESPRSGTGAKWEAWRRAGF